MGYSNFCRKYLCVFAVIAAVIFSSVFSPQTFAVYANTPLLDSYDSKTDIGNKLLPSGEYSAPYAYRNQIIFKAVNYNQSCYNLTANAEYHGEHAETGLRFIVAKAKDSESDGAEVTIEIVKRGYDVHVFARTGRGSDITVKDFYKSKGEAGKTGAYAIRYSNGRLWFYENNQTVIAGLNLNDSSRFKDIRPYVGLASLFASVKFNDLHLWGNGVEYYGDFPKMPAGNGNYAEYMGIKSINGTSTKLENGVLYNDRVCADMVQFTKLPFGNNDTVAWSFDLNVESAEKSFHGARPILRADENFKNQYKLVITAGSVIVMYNDTELESALYKRTLGKTDNFGVVMSRDTVSVWVNGTLVIDSVYLEEDLPINLGMKYEFAKSSMKNIKLFYTDSVKFQAPQADPQIPKMTSGMYNGAKYMKVMSGAKEVSYENFTVKRAENSGNAYTFKNIPFPENADYTIRTDLYISKGFNKAWEGPRIMFRNGKQGDIYLAFCSTRVILLAGGTTELASYPMNISLNKTYDVAINSNSDEVSVWIDGKLIFNREPLSKTGDSTVAKAGIWFENCEAVLSNLKIYGQSIVLTDDVFSLELDKNPYFNSTAVPKKPQGNINHFENTKLSSKKVRGSYANGKLSISIGGTKSSYQFLDQEDSKALNGLKKSDTFVWHSKVKASQIAPVEIEGQERADAAVMLTVKQSDHPSSSNINYRTTLYIADNKLELQVWQDSTKIKSYVKDDFVLQKDKEYAIDMLVAPEWMKVWVDNKLMFTAFDLPDYQLYFNIDAVNIAAEISDFDLYNVESEPDGKVLPLAKATRERKAGDTLASIAASAIPLDGNVLQIVTVIITSVVLIAAVTAAVIILKKFGRKKTAAKETKGASE